MLVINVSNNTDRMGIMGTTTRITNNKWLCVFNQLNVSLSNTNAMKLPPEIAVKDLNVYEIPTLTKYDIPW